MDACYFVIVEIIPSRALRVILRGARSEKANPSAVGSPWLLGIWTKLMESMPQLIKEKSEKYHIASQSSTLESKKLLFTND